MQVADQFGSRKPDGRQYVLALHSSWVAWALCMLIGVVLFAPAEWQPPVSRSQEQRTAHPNGYGAVNYLPRNEVVTENGVSREFGPNDAVGRYGGRGEDSQLQRAAAASAD